MVAARSMMVGSLTDSDSGGDKAGQTWPAAPKTPHSDGSDWRGTSQVCGTIKARW